MFDYYEDDQTFGDAASYGYGALLRDIELQIEGVFQSASNYYSIGNDALGIQSTLNAKGWIVEQVTYETQTWFSGPDVYRVFAVVGSNYTDRQVQDQIRRDLAGYFNVSATSVLSAPYTPPTQVQGGAGGNISTPAANYQTTPPATTNQNVAPSVFSNSFFDSIGVGLGVSTPIVIGGAALLLVLMLKK